MSDSLTIIIASLLLTLLVIALLSMFMGGVAGMFRRWYWCHRCGLYYDDCGVKTTVPPDRLSVKTGCCDECLKKGSEE